MKMKIKPANRIRTKINENRLLKKKRRMECFRTVTNFEGGT